MKKFSFQKYRVGPVRVSPRPSVGLSVRWVNCGKMADWIWMPFGMVS